MEALTIFSFVATVVIVEWVTIWRVSRETRRLQCELRSAWTAMQMMAQNHNIQTTETSRHHNQQLRDLAVTLTAQSKATSAAEAVDVHHAVMAASAPPEPAIKTPPPAKGIKLRDGLEIDFITEPTEAQMAEVDEDMVLR